MALNSRNLSALAYANGFTLWHYKTVDTAAVVDAAGYFNEAKDIFHVGDMVLVNADMAEMPKFGVFVVNANAGGTVGLATLTAFEASVTAPTSEAS